MGVACTGNNLHNLTFNSPEPDALRNFPARFRSYLQLKMLNQGAEFIRLNLVLGSNALQKMWLVKLTLNLGQSASHASHETFDFSF